MNAERPSASESEMQEEPREQSLPSQESRQNPFSSRKKKENPFGTKAHEKTHQNGSKALKTTFEEIKEKDSLSSKIVEQPFAHDKFGKKDQASQCTSPLQKSRQNPFSSRKKKENPFAMKTCGKMDQNGSKTLKNLCEQPIKNEEDCKSSTIAGQSYDPGNGKGEKASPCSSPLQKSCKNPFGSRKKKENPFATKTHKEMNQNGLKSLKTSPEQPIKKEENCKSATIEPAAMKLPIPCLRRNHLAPHKRAFVPSPDRQEALAYPLSPTFSISSGSWSSALDSPSTSPQWSLWRTKHITPDGLERALSVSETDTEPSDSPFNSTPAGSPSVEYFKHHWIKDLRATKPDPSDFSKHVYNEFPCILVEWKAALLDALQQNKEGLISRFLEAGNAATSSDTCVWFDFQSGSSFKAWNDGDKAAARAHLNLLSLKKDSLRFTYHALSEASKSGSLQTVQWIHQHSKSKATKDAMNFAAEHGHLTIVEWLHQNRTEGCSTYAMNNASRNGHLKIIEWLHSNRTEGCTSMAMDLAASGGKIDVVKWLHKNRSEGCTQMAMNGSSMNGHLEMTEWLHEHRTEGCTKEVMCLTAEKGHLSVVQWLYKNRKECLEIDSEPLIWSAANGHLSIVEWYHQNNFEGFSARVTDAAAKSGHLHLVEWLLANRDEGARQALDQAAGHGHLQTAEWLYAKGCATGGFTNKAMDMAAALGHLQMLEWLQKVSDAGCTTAAMDDAAEYGHLDVLEWLHRNRSEGCSKKAFSLAEEGCHYEVLNWLKHTFPSMEKNASPHSPSLRKGMQESLPW